MNLTDDTPNLSVQISAWSVPNSTDGGDGVFLGTLADTSTVADGNPTIVQTDTSGWSLKTILVIVLGPLGVVLLVSYIVHWYQVAQKIQINRNLRKAELGVGAHPKVSAMLSIRALERQTQTGTFMDMMVDPHDEYGIEITRDIRLVKKQIS